MTASSAKIATGMSQGRIRRIPVQRRSRERVEGILQAAEQIVVRDGVDALSTRSVATAADVPVASVYQYFADREAIIAALIERHVVAMDDQLSAAVAALETFSIRSLMEATVGAYVAGYAKRPSYVALWFQGRVSPEIVAFVRGRSEDLADRYHGFAVAAGLVRPGTGLLPFELVAELIDSFLAIAYRDSLEGDEQIVGEGIEMMIRYLEPYATTAGIEGVSRAALAASLDVGTTT